MINFAKQLYPIHRSITGKGVRKTLNLIKSKLKNLKIRSYNCGEKVFDWKIPAEWNITDGYIADLNGRKIINFKENNLRVVSYSTSIKKTLSKKILLNHIYTIPKRIDAIPYVTSYYKKNWGFCLRHSELNLLKDQKYKVNIQSSFNKNGKLNYGEYFIKGKSKKEILIYTYICHPQLANNEVSGPTVATYLANYFSKRENNFSLRFVFAPETIGAISYIKNNLRTLKKNIIGGYVLTCLGDERNYSFLETKDKKSLSNIIAKEVFKESKIKFKNYSFLKRGSDERQFNSPGVDLPIASIMRTRYGEYPEYHNSDDNFKIVTNRGLKNSFNIIKRIIEKFNSEIIPIATYKCEPFLSKRGLYNSIGTGKVNRLDQKLLDFLMYSDGTNRLHEIKKKINLKQNEMKIFFNLAKKNKLIL